MFPVPRECNTQAATLAARCLSTTGGEHSYGSSHSTTPPMSALSVSPFSISASLCTRETLSFPTSNFAEINSPKIFQNIVRVTEYF